MNQFDDRIVEAGMVNSLPPTTFIQDDQSGRTYNQSPNDDAAADTPAPQVSNISSTLHIYHAYWRVPQVTSFRALFIYISISGTEPRQHQLDLSFITDSDLDLTNVTWNNQGSLTYETIAAIPSPMQRLTVPNFHPRTAETGIIRSKYWCTAIGDYSLSSGASIYGIRIRVNGAEFYSDPEQAGGEEPGQTVDSKAYFLI